METTVFWYWWLAALVLAAAEILAPGTILMWLGLAAGLTGLIALIAPALGWPYQLLAFSVLALASIAGLRRILQKGAGGHDTLLNRRAEQYFGRTLTVCEAVTNGRGKVRVGDSAWPATGPDLATGSLVRVTGVEGNALRVEALESQAAKTSVAAAPKL